MRELKCSFCILACFLISSLLKLWAAADRDLEDINTCVFKRRGLWPYLVSWFADATGTTRFLKGNMSHAAVMLMCIALEVTFQLELVVRYWLSNAIHLGLGKMMSFWEKMEFLEDLYRLMQNSCHYFPNSNMHLQHVRPIPRNKNFLLRFSFTGGFTENVFVTSHDTSQCLMGGVRVHHWNPKWKGFWQSNVKIAQGEKHPARINDFLSDMAFAGWTQELWVIIRYKFSPLYWHYMLL